jgi:hypothetical protein
MPQHVRVDLHVEARRAGGTFHHGLEAAGAMTARRFPPPWSIDGLEACFVVRNHAGH